MHESTEFLEIAKTLEDVSKTSSKNEKVSYVAELLKKLGEKDVLPTVRILVGKPIRIEKRDTLQVGYSTLRDVILEITGCKESDMYDLYLRYGDLGLVAYVLFEKKSETSLFQQRLTVQSVAKTLEDIAKLSGKRSKSERKKYIKSLLLNARPIEAKYIVKMLTGEMRTGMVEGLVEEAIAKAYSIEKEKARELHMILGDLAALAEMAATKRLDEVKLSYFRPISFMLAETAKDIPDVINHFKKKIFAEFKYDGIRAQIHKKEKNVKIYSRRLEDITEFFPEIVERSILSSSDFILDGEIVPFKNSRPLPFYQLQRRLRRIFELDKVMKSIPVEFFAFDILLHNSNQVFRLPLKERALILEKVANETLLKVAERRLVETEEELVELFETSRRLGYEGLVLKDPDSKYVLGRRGADWLKLKKELDTLDAVIVAAEYGHGKRAGLLSDYTFAVRNNDDFVTIGKAYSGLTDEEIKEMTDKLNQITVQDLGFMKKVKPEIVVEVAFDSIQKSKRHSSGFALRFPRIKRIRYDKRPEDADTLDKVVRIYNSSYLTSPT
jgi:DNA ligase-1